jgi:hypothetical protein
MNHFLRYYGHESGLLPFYMSVEAYGGSAHTIYVSNYRIYKLSFVNKSHYFNMYIGDN